MHYNSDDGKKICKFKANNKNDNFPTQFRLAIISQNARSQKMHFWKKNVYDLLVGYNATDKSETLIIHKYSMVKNNVK